jgi:hypothetical protein
MKMTVSWDVAPCSLIELYRRFRETVAVEEAELNAQRHPSPVEVCRYDYNLFTCYDTAVFKMTSR